MSEQNATGTILAPDTTPTTAPPADTSPPSPAASDWRASLPEDIAGDPTLKNIKNVPEMAKSYVNAQRMLGGRIPIPKPEDKDGWNEVYNKLGRPAEPVISEKGYVVPTENMPENFKFDDAKLAAFAKEAHEAGLSKQQFARMARLYASTTASDMESLSKGRAEFDQNNVAELQKEWGPKAFDQNVQLARDGVAAAAKIAGLDANEVKEHLNTLGISNDSKLVKLFHAFGKTMASDEVVGGGHTRKFILTPAEARAEISRMISDPVTSKAIRDKNHPDHNSAMARWNELNAAQASE